MITRTKVISQKNEIANWCFHVQVLAVRDFYLTHYVLGPHS